MLDPRFGSQGASFLYVEDGSAAALAVQPDGKVIALSDTNSGPVILVRLTDRGRFDTTFGEGGTSTHFGSPDVYVASALSLQPDGKILVAGSVYGTQGTRMFVSRFLTNGDPDPSFGAGGLVVTEFPGLFAGASALALGADGKIVAAGYAGLLGSSDSAAARDDLDGTLDASFGTGGRVVVDAGGGTYVEGARAVVVEATAGSCSEAHRILREAVSSCSVSCRTVRSMLRSGPRESPAGAGPWAECHGIALQPDGKILAAGTREDVDSPMVALRLLRNGTPDPSSGAAGVAMLRAPGGAEAVALDAAGRLVSPDHRFLLADARRSPRFQPRF